MDMKFTHYKNRWAKLFSWVWLPVALFGFFYPIGPISDSEQAWTPELPLVTQWVDACIDGDHLVLILAGIVVISFVVLSYVMWVEAWENASVVIKNGELYFVPGRRIWWPFVSEMQLVDWSDVDRITINEDASGRVRGIEVLPYEEAGILLIRLNDMETLARLLTESVPHLVTREQGPLLFSEKTVATRFMVVLGSCVLFAILLHIVSLLLSFL